MASNISISPLIFQRCFQQAWSGSRRARVGSGNAKYDKDDDLLQLPRRFGIAVSGGADSMALAYLCKQLERSSEYAGAISVTAFVVDHRARPESTNEAQKVAGWLRDMDIKTQILSLDWSGYSSGQNKSSLVKSGESMSMPSAFETHARRLRFQALGLACHEFKLETLLLGHHQDDNVETTIWRLSTGAKGLGLGGIPEVARIPECHGLFGASESWSTTSIPIQPTTLPRPKVRFNDRNHGLVSFSDSSTNFIKETNGTTSNLASHIKIASPGILLCRPLLSFTKASILETCHKNNVPYVSDPTNFDPTLTPRNAIRSLRASNSLPRALESQSILSLIRSSRELLQKSNELSDSLLSSQCRILDFNPKAGSAVIQFLEPSPAFMDPQLATLSAFQTKQIQTLVLRRITELVSPFPDSHFPLRSYEQFIHNMFPDPEGAFPDQIPQKSFTLAGVMFQRLANDTTTINQSETEDPGSRGDNIWLLSRQPFMKDRDPVTQVSVSPRGNFTPWTLWDNRYWIRLRLVSSDSERDPSELGIKLTQLPLTIRPLHKLDVERVRRDTMNSRPKGTKKNSLVERDTPGAFEHLKALLSVEAPSQVRFTLPVVSREGVNSRPGKPFDQKVRQQLALPTLGYRLSGHSAEYASENEVELVHLRSQWKLKWQWMYKMIDTEALRLMGWPAGRDTEDA